MAEKKGEKRKTVSDRELAILEFWQKNRIFEKSEKGTALGFFERVWFRITGKRDFIFYDGPPFATGLPHMGHLLISSVKDAVARYKTMRGYLVRRRWGWDCHGLPLEVEMEKKIGSTSKKDIEVYGIEKFNAGIRSTIFQYVDEWKKIIPRIGRWVDMENDYRTVTTKYIESVWSVFKQLHHNGFVSHGFKPLHLCPRCGTTVSNNEVADSYTEITDTAVYVLFPLRDDPKTQLIAWTTTPWTLFGNVALGIDRDAQYAVIEEGDVHYVVHERARKLLKGGTVIATKRGAEFVGKSYIPPLPDLYPDAADQKKLWQVYAMPDIDADVGTGIVHLAPAYGADDFEFAQREGLPIRHHVTRDGTFVEALGAFAGLRPKQAGNPKEVDEKILAALKRSNALHHHELFVHSYPVCWRCSTPLLNYATDSWFVDADRYRDDMIAENKKIQWIPEHVRDGRFGKWLEHARPWAVSRSRFWGAPMPVWQVEKTGKYLIVGSIQELYSRIRSKNTYTFVRHAHAISNERQIFNCRSGGVAGITEKGKGQAEKVAEKLKDTKPTIIFCSPLKRTRQTAEYIAEKTGAKIIEDPLLIELQVPEAHDKSYQALNDLATASGAYQDLHKKIGTGESYNDVYVRLVQFLEKVDAEYQDAHIIVVVHRVQMASARRIHSRDVFPYTYLADHFSSRDGNTSTFTLAYKSLPRDEHGDIELHRPFIDDTVIYDDDGNPARHIKEVFDCWFESGSMPYGSRGYPFFNIASFNPGRKSQFPADFICEGLDQTRGWFYSMLAIGVGAFKKAPYRRVIATGLIRAGDGKKMSKSFKNYTDPMDLIDRYGADAIRHYLLGSPVVRGESVTFQDELLDEVQKKVYSRLHNCFLFYATYAHLPHQLKSKHPLDRYILSRLGETHAAMTQGFEQFRLDSAVSPIASFVDDLSTWYLRRSRDRLRHDTEDGAYARETLRFTLTEFSKCLAPIAPFYAEHLFAQMFKYQSHFFTMPESVHLCRWPKRMPISKSSIALMQTARDIVSDAHEQRAAAEIKVRQPLARVVIRPRLPAQIQTIIADELHVHEVVVDVNARDLVSLDITLTDALKAEGFVQECIRNIQLMRKNRGLSLTETISELQVHAPDSVRELFKQFEEKITHEVQTNTITYVADLPEHATSFTVDGSMVSVLPIEQPGKLFS